MASLLSSLTQFSIGSPHTGSQKLREEDEWIPAAAITVEDAAMMGRMQARGQWLRRVCGTGDLCGFVVLW